MYSHFIYHNYNKRRKDSLTKGAKRCEVNSRSNWNKDATPSPWPPGHRPPHLFSGLNRYHCVNIPEIIFRYIAALTWVPVQQSRTGYFKLLFQTAVTDMKHSFQSCDRPFIACLTSCLQCSALNILQRCTISRLYRNFVQHVKHKHCYTVFC